MKTTQTMPTAFNWNGHDYATQRLCEIGIQQDIAHYLCDSGGGSVEVGATEEQEGENFPLSIRVDILTEEGKRAVDLADAAPELLAACEYAERAFRTVNIRQSSAVCNAFERLVNAIQKARGGK